MDKQFLAGAVAATTFVFGLGAAPLASAAGDAQVVGIEQSVGDPDAASIAYTVSKIVPSADAVAYPVAGQLYEATVMARATRGTVVPVAQSFSARADGGANYPALAQVSSLSGAPLQEGSTANGKVYFDAVGAAPDSVVFDNGLLVWNQPTPGDPGTGGSSSGGGSTGGGGGSEGVMGSTGPNDVSPDTSGGESGNTGEDGTEGGGGNLSSGGGAGAPNGDTGGDSGG